MYYFSEGLPGVFGNKEANPIVIIFWEQEEQGSSVKQELWKKIQGTMKFVKSEKGTKGEIIKAIKSTKSKTSAGACGWNIPD